MDYPETPDPDYPDVSVRLVTLEDINPELIGSKLEWAGSVIEFETIPRERKDGGTFHHVWAIEAPQKPAKSSVLRVVVTSESGQKNQANLTARFPRRPLQGDLLPDDLSTCTAELFLVEE